MRINLYTILFALLSLLVYSPNDSLAQPIKHFTFKIESKNQLDTLSKYISIDNYDSGKVTAYANTKEFKRFLSWGIKYSLLSNLKSTQIIEMATTVEALANWDKYPTYEVYLEYLQLLAQNYPETCQLLEIATLNSGRKIMGLKISDYASTDTAPEPELLYTGTMHGDETSGYILFLRLAEYLLKNYNQNGFEHISHLINNSEIFILPNTNPDGTYYGGNHDVSEAIRYNANFIDLNRNYPGIDGDSNPDGNETQEETLAMMNFASQNHFALSANTHGGIEVVNYPWDTWVRRTADDAWWQMVSRNYATSVQENSPDGIFTDLNNGITNGYDWYTTTGNRQDYMNYFHYCREMTLELSSVKLIPSEALNEQWIYHHEALINYLMEGLHGLHGVVTNIKGEVLHARIEVLNHDMDNSWVYTDPRAGDFARYLKAGSYSVQCSAEGYQSQTKHNVAILDGSSTILNFVLDSSTTVGLDESKQVFNVSLSPNPFNTDISLKLSSNLQGYVLKLYDLQGRQVYSQWLEPKQVEFTIHLTQHEFKSGIYQLQLSNSKERHHHLIIKQ